jgi:hypothetical protein
MHGPWTMRMRGTMKTIIKISKKELVIRFAESVPNVSMYEYSGAFVWLYFGAYRKEYRFADVLSAFARKYQGVEVVVL